MIIKFIKSLEFYLWSIISQTVGHLCNGLVLTVLLRKVFPCGKWKKMTVERRHPFQSGSCPSKQSRANKYDSVRLPSCTFNVHHLVYVRCDWHETIFMSVNPIRSQDRTLECSICQLLVPVPAKGIEAFPLNFFINNMLTVLAVQNPTKCTNCEDSSQATARCLDCVENLCTNCVFAHKRIRQTIDHRILSFDEIQANEVKDIIRCPSFCSVHPREVRHQFFIREPKQQRRWQLRKRHLKSEVLLLQTWSRLFHFVQFIKFWQFCLELNSKRLYRRWGKEKESLCLVLQKTWKEAFSRRSHAVTAKKCTKKVWCTCKVVVLLI